MELDVTQVRTRQPALFFGHGSPMNALGGPYAEGWAVLGRSVGKPKGAVMVSAEIHDTFMQGPEHLIEFFHGYTYSGNPVASAAGLATLETYKEEGLLTRGAALAKVWEDALHSLKGLPHVIDIRNIGLVGAIELEPIAGSPTKRAFSAFLKAYEQGLLIRTTGDIIALSPPLIISESQIGEIVSTLSGILKTLE